MPKKIIFWMMALVVILSACATEDEPKAQSPTQVTNQNPSTPYPVPEKIVSSPAAYPAPTEFVEIDPYPAVEEIPSDIIPFSFDKPLSNGNSIISGTGPAGVPIEVVDVTFMRAVLAKGIISGDNTFSFELDTPLETGHRVGIALGELAGTEWTEDQFTNKFYNGSQAMNVPTLGFFFDTAMVK